MLNISFLHLQERLISRNILSNQRPSLVCLLLYVKLPPLPPPPHWFPVLLALTVERFFQFKSQFCI